ncbi:hypothetical protein C8Q80DRAFT_145802 [Daedaleopsis nitida]|nr:hypothetical protein C8Q80DRAFT_145802 [Daedaleopsis nitida]
MSTLPYDVLCMLYPLLPRVQVLALMQSSKEMYTAGVRRLLTFGVTISSDDQLVSFCKFILRDAPMRARWLRRLAIRIELHPTDYLSDETDYEAMEPDDTSSDGEEVENHDMSGDDFQEDATNNKSMEDDGPEDSAEEDGSWEETDGNDTEQESIYEMSVCSYDVGRLKGGPLLVRVLSETMHLEDIEIEWFEELLLDCRALVNVIMELETILRFRMTSFALNTLTVVQGFKSPLVEVDIEVSSYHQSASLDVLEILASFSSTLQKVTISSGDFSHGLVMPSEQTPRFLRVHTLSLLLCETILDSQPHDPPFLPLLVRTFPNLRTLEFTDYIPSREGSVEVEHRKNSAISQFNVWEDLQDLRGDLESLYALGLNRPVSRVEISDVGRDSVMAYNRLHDVVHVIRPTQLLLQVGYGDHAQQDLAGLLCLSACVVAAGHLTCLVLDINIVLLGLRSHHAMAVTRLLERLPNLKVFVLRAGKHPSSTSSQDERPAVRFCPDSSEHCSFCFAVRRWHSELFLSLSKGVEFFSLEYEGSPGIYWKWGTEIWHDVDYVCPPEVISFIRAERLQFHPVRGLSGVEKRVRGDN